MRLTPLALVALVSLAACSKPETAEAPQGVDVAAVAPAGLTLGDDGLPRMRAGLWEVVRTDDGEVETTRHCTGAEVDAEVREMLTRETPGCKTERAARPSGLKVHAVCEQAGGLKTDATITMTGSETAYDMTVGIYLVKADGSREGSDVTAKAKWIGACPAGVQPGEAVAG
ncbi:MAG: DUF3617 domain-containing protein [Alphaproteobacteria bacterium]|nr:DUF3617 domain-containing protein [Alphaproteobacteria bacterium]MBU1516236.1 DUF3617 domain-containing protein [Alphaproteobacteria bacterium]MBU2095773.1 DUF3617 domain-containing protein [Alphaproteobacteria bacterium]MBU2151990.1 DUF3617 domain-containing protein [Alphaproteobacteria bacterium]MBU2306828.1 DUF3617 domain-containing protein [Alphaproteobacteria bacterium]